MDDRQKTRHLGLLRALARAQDEHERVVALAGLDPVSARRRLELHYRGEPLPGEDEELLQRFERAKADPTFSNVERARLKRDLVAHPVLGGPAIVGLPDLQILPSGSL
jgi:hypothetical protein